MPKTPGSQLNDPSILLVDDEEMLLRVLARQLRIECDCRVDTALSALAAIQILNRRTFDVVVSDLEMPGMRGDTFLRLVRDRYPETRRVLLTGFPTAHLVGTGAEGVADLVLEKGLDSDLLFAEICWLVRAPRSPK